MDRRPVFGQGVHFALLTIAFAEFTAWCSTTGILSAAPAAIFLKAINPDTNRPLESLRGGTLFSILPFAITAAAYFWSSP